MSDRTSELEAALEREAATREILRVINRSPGDYQPVFDAILENAARLCDAPLGFLLIREADGFHFVAERGCAPETLDYFRANPLPLDPEHSVTARTAAERRPLQVSDVAAHPLSQTGQPHRRLGVEVERVRTQLTVPMIRGDECIGVILVYRREVRAFEDDQVALLSTFADQAVIAIENVRRFKALGESLERQTATSEILRAISRSPTDYAPVFEAVLENATRLCGAPFGTLFLVKDDHLHIVANLGGNPAFIDFLDKTPLPLVRHATASNAARERFPVQNVDIADEAYRAGDPIRVFTVDVGGVRTLLAVPMLKGNETVGVIALYRQEVKAFEESGIEVVSTFADQAVIAIENVRQFQQVQARTADLTQALERQTATSEILRSISRSPTDYAPVFNTILGNAVRLCGAPFGTLFLLRDGYLQIVADAGSRREMVEHLRANPIALDEPDAVSSRAARDQVPTQIADMMDEAYRSGDPRRRAAVETGGIRTWLAVPMLKGEATVGVIALYRHEVKPFLDDDIALVSTFADQAVIAIENVRQFQQVQARTADLTHSLERQTATSEILRSISRSPTDFAPVFDTILENATHLCGAPFGTLFLLRDDHLHMVADSGAEPGFLAYMRANPLPMTRPGPAGPLVLAAREHAPAQFDDIMDDRYRSGERIRTAAVEIGKVRTLLGVPLLKGGETVGVIALYRQEVKPFADDDIALVSTFADQAVIAIENVRQFQQVQARTADLTRSLERQTATSEILRNISQSPTDYAPVFDTILQHATRLCGAPFSVLYLLRDEYLHMVANQGGRPEFMQIIRDNPLPMTRPDPGPLVRAALNRATVQFDDILDDVHGWTDRFRTTAAEIGKIRTLLGVPLLKGETTIGVIALFREEVQPFADDEIQLVSTFADQAVIAIENVRQFQAVQEHTAALTESLKRQTATSEILRSISQSPTDYGPVFDTILESATRLCGAPFGTLFLLQDEQLHLVADAGSRPEMIERIRANPRQLDNPVAVTSRAAREQVPVQVEDFLSQDLSRAAPITVEGVEEGGIRTLLGVPMLKGNETVGVIALYRQEVKAFEGEDIELVRTFADQAVIAIENVRQFQQVQERTADLTQSLERQTATSEILRVISRSPGDYQPVFEAILQNAVRLCRAPFGSLFLVRDDHLHFVADVGSHPEFIKYLRANPYSLDDPVALISRAARERAPRQIEDLMDDAYRAGEPVRIASVKLGQMRTLLGVPILKDDETIGLIALYRREVDAFSDSEIDLVRTFADQAVIAIENVRQFQQVQARTADLTQSLERQTATSEILRTISQSPTDYGPVFDAILDNATRLCDAPLAFLLMREGDAFHFVAHHGSRPEFTEFLRANPVPVDSQGALPSLAAREGVPKQLVDSADSEPYRNGSNIHRVAAVDIEGTRTALFVPMMKSDVCVGIIALYRREVRAFVESHLALVSTFADQAVIAIDNVRLFQALEARTAALTQTLERQTATSEILRNISQSPTDYAPVFDTILQNATRLCGAPFGVLYLLRDEHLHMVANQGVRPEFVQRMRDSPIPMSRPNPGPLVRAALNSAAVQFDDILDDVHGWTDRFRTYAAEVGNVRTLIGVPLLKGETTVGVIGLFREEVQAFADDEIQLVSTFADQAVIAIENVRQFQQVQARTADLTQSLERQTATSEILRTISQSPTDYGPVFDAILDNATRLCEAPLAYLLMREGDAFHFVAHHGSRPEFTEFLRANPVPVDSLVALPSLAAREGVAKQLVDFADSEPYRDGSNLHRVAAVDIEGTRTALFVPMMKGKECVGIIALYRREVRAFVESHLALVSTFADQAVIAIDNVRLFQTLEARTAALTRTLERQTATSEILRSISRSPTDYQPVFETILENAVRLCGAPFGCLFLVRDGHLHVVADARSHPEMIEYLRAHPLPLTRSLGPITRAARERVPVQFDDMMDDVYRSGDPIRVQTVDIGGVRTLLGVPMLKDDEAVGVIVLYRQKVKPFADDDIELVSTFADQAVIAIENVRLFQALESRTNDLSELLERQTATSEILRSISHSPTDYQPVFDTILGNGIRLCDAHFAGLFLVRDGHLDLAASLGGSAEFVEFSRAATYPIDLPGSLIGRAARDRLPQHEVDVRDSDRYRAREQFRVGTVELGGIRTMLAVPLCRSEETLGVLALFRQEVRAFGDDEIELVQTFADQAVIAMENVRLFQTVEARSAELAQSVAELEALGDVAQAVSSSLDLETVLNTIVERAVQLSGASLGAINELDEATGTLPPRAAPGAEKMLELPAPRLGEGAVGRAAATRTPVQIPDITVPGAYTGRLLDALSDLRIRALLAVPMVQDDSVLGTLVVARRTPGEFPAETIRVLQALGTQSAIAIRNARLFREIEEQSHELEAANRHKSEFLANMSHELRTPLNAVIGFSEVLGERMFGDLNDKQDEYVKDIHDSGRHLLSLINDILDLSKIEAGAMELDIGRFDLAPALDNALTLVRERAGRRGISLDAQIAGDLGQMQGDERKLKQILLNLLSNAIKFTNEGGTVTLEAMGDGENVHIAVRDTGVGISVEDQAVIFDEFKQVGTDYARKVEGTGLGLTLTRRFVEMHGGSINVESEPGKGSVFRVSLPLRPPEATA